ncbi:S-adenosyl-L-methionine-dependent methyltransferase [Coprinopsis marcescibilis]|uniref:S-adenosyl-L-methionine-dependent methyltransferase n=1 Tax=Coprinopsis marcescibilis TaxID=230819 RepID=A0A5C3L5A9_COPMA|nr:S-adenosyl-L-methionine-dependent methyltransferase [Coprinopsis marcescibilis]
MSSQLLDTASTHPFSFTGIADRVWSGTLETAIRAGWGPATWVARAAVLSVMKSIVVGKLTVRTDSRVYTFPDPEDRDQLEHESSGPEAELRVVKDTFWIRLCLMGDLGFAEAYMYGEVQCDDLATLFRVFLANKERLSNLDSKLSYLFTLPQKLTSYRFLNTISNSRSNISAHYDISNEMFAGFLSADMTYSCAIFDDLDGDLGRVSQRRRSEGDEMTSRSSPDAALPSGLKRLPRERDHLPPSPPLTENSSSGSQSRAELGAASASSSSDLLSLATSQLDFGYTEHSAQASVQGDSEGERDELYLAQLRKLDHIIQRLRIPSHRPVRILEIGSGWGSMAIRIAEKYPLAHIDTLTLSVQQQTLARERIRKRGKEVEGRIDVHLMDYRAMPADWRGAFDRVVSVEMIEAVGYEFLERYWEVVDWALSERDAMGVVQVITLPEARLQRYLQEIDFIRKWVFPGGFLPTLTLLLSTLQSGSKGKLVVDSVSNIGPHYARTLREWHDRFIDRFEEVIKPALENEYPTVMGAKCKDREKALEEVEVFKRKWIYYYRYCEVGFTTRTLGDHIITFAREGYEEFGCTVYE